MDVVVVAGSHGLIGTALLDALRGGTTVRRLVRGTPTGPDEYAWDPARGVLDVAALDGADAVVNLAGVGVGDHRWTRAYRRAILRSRLTTTGLLARAITTMDSPPRVWIQASAIGYYGDRGRLVLTEGIGPGVGFLADVARHWERATHPARDATRVVTVRSGIVLSGRGGALGRLLPVVRSGLGGRLGPGTQFWSWITLTDEVRAILHLLDADTAGPVNLVSPDAATNAEVISALAAAVRRPARLPVPATALRLGLGGFAEDLLASTRAVPRALGASGFVFAHPTLDVAMRAALADVARPPHVG